MRGIFVLMFSGLLISCITTKEKSLCEELGWTTEVARYHAKNAVEKLSSARPVWDSVYEESLEIDDVRVWYLASFKIPPVSNVDVIFDCSGSPRRVRYDKWGELSQKQVAWVERLRRNPGIVAFHPPNSPNGSEHSQNHSWHMFVNLRGPTPNYNGRLSPQSCSWRELLFHSDVAGLNLAIISRARRMYMDFSSGASCF